MNKLIMSRVFTPFLLITAFAGCVKAPDSAPPPPTKTALASDPAASEPVVENDVSVSAERQAFDGLAFVVPSDWNKVELTDFQKGIISGRFHMPEVGAELEVTLSKASGGFDANLNRWRGQFVQSREEMTDTLSLAGETATLVDLQGQFSPGFGKEANGEWRMIGVIVPLPPQSYFIKLTGPVDQVSAVEESFMDFVRSLGPALRSGPAARPAYNPARQRQAPPPPALQRRPLTPRHLPPLQVLQPPPVLHLQLPRRRAPRLRQRLLQLRSPLRR